jgi:uncharacterized protein (DUF983 family)
MPSKLMEHAVPCPWCGQGKTFADNYADIRISCQCNICSRFYKIDFQTLRAVRTKPKPRTALK